MFDNIEQMRAAFKQNESSSDSEFTNNYYPFWLMPNDAQAVVRFLPDGNENNPMGFFVEKRMHNLVINGEKKSVPCLTTYGEDCPICKVSSAFYGKSTDPKKKDAWGLKGKAYWRKKQYLTQAIVLEDPLPANVETGETYAGKVCCLALGFQLYTIIKEASMSGELDTVPFLFKNGVDFTIKKSAQGEYSTYAMGSRFSRKNRDLTDDEVALAQEHMIDLSTLLPKKPELERVEQMLAASLQESGDALAAGASVAPAATSAPAQEAAPEPAPAQAAPEPTVEDDESSDEADAILAEIRNRKSNQA